VPDQAVRNRRSSALAHRLAKTRPGAVILDAVGGRVRTVAIGVLVLGAAVPGVAIAVRPSVSPVAQGYYTGSSPEGPATFWLTIADNEQPSGHSFFTYAPYSMTFVSECAPSGLKLRNGFVIPGRRTRAGQQLHFHYHSRGVVIRGALSGPLGGPNVRGTVQISRPGCDGDVLPFTATLKPV